MKINPITPIWLMLVLSIITILYIIYKNKKINKKVLLRISLIILLFIINIRPMYVTDKGNTTSSNINVLFVIDTTLSMQAEDMENSKTRIEQVKKDCEYIINTLPSASYSIITFNNDAKQLVPFTSDVTMILNSIAVTKSIDELYANGSSLNTPQEKMEDVLKNTSKNSENQNILFYLSDGEITDDKEKLKSFSNIKKYVSNGAILGYGTTKGGYMKYIDYNDKEQYVTYYDDNYREIKGLSKIDENNLKQIANDLEIEYIHMDKQKNIDKLLKNIAKSTTSKIDKTNITSYEDIYFLIIIPLLIILFLIYKEYKEEYSL